MIRGATTIKALFIWKHCDGRIQYSGEAPHRAVQSRAEIVVWNNPPIIGGFIIQILRNCVLDFT